MRVSFGDIIIGLVTPVIVPIAVSANPIHVDANATGPSHDGMSWCTAYLFLQDALAAAEMSGGLITEIRVADGVYKPDQGANQIPGDHAATFQLLNGVTIAGGYAGCGADDPDLRDVTAHETILSGDLLGDDTGDTPFEWSGRFDNCCHVVTANGTNATAGLEGCTITSGGWGLGCFVGSAQWGGGMLNLGGGPTVTDCTFTRNFAIIGSSMYNADGAGAIVSGCTFANNAASSFGDVVNLNASSASFEDCVFVGLGIPPPIATGFYATGGSVTFTNCEFRGHFGAEGSAVWSDGQEIVFMQCVFQDNHASGRGGAVYLRDPRAIFTDCMFRRNRASGGGSVYLDNTLNAEHITFRRGHFLKNEADNGGAVAMTGLHSSEITFSECRFIDNRAQLGGSISVNASIPFFNGCVFQGNHAGESGGGLYFDGSTGAWIFNTLITQNVSEAGNGGGVFARSTDLSVANCSIISNTAMQRSIMPVLSEGGGLYLEQSFSTLANNILWANRDSSGTDESAQISRWMSTVLVQNTAIQGLDQLAGSGNIGDDPLFTPGPGGCYYLSQTGAGQAADSPGVDSGSGDAQYSNLDGLTTRSDEAADMGAVDMGYHHSVTGQPVIPGDYDRNLVLDLADVAGFQNCFTGSGPTDVSPCCRIFDFQSDGDVDLEDGESLVTSLDGP